MWSGKGGHSECKDRKCIYCHCCSISTDCDERCTHNDHTCRADYRVFCDEGDYRSN